MKNWVYICIVCLLSCQSSHKESSHHEAFQLYTDSEMVDFMEKMYNGHQHIKQQLLSDKPISSLPYQLEKIHTAQLTDASDYNEQYRQMADLFIEAERKILSDTLRAKQHYNQAVKRCISCHQVRCSGPIPRIKKLLITPR